MYLQKKLLSQNKISGRGRALWAPSLDTPLWSPGQANLLRGGTSSTLLPSLVIAPAFPFLLPLELLDQRLVRYVELAAVDQRRLNHFPAYPIYNLKPGCSFKCSAGSASWGSGEARLEVESDTFVRGHTTSWLMVVAPPTPPSTPTSRLLVLSFPLPVSLITLIPQHFTKVLQLFWYEQIVTVRMYLFQQSTITGSTS